MYNSRKIEDLRSDVAANCRVWLALCREAGLNVLVTGTVRDAEYQMQCYRNGTSRAKKPAFHAQGIGLAFDFCKNVKGQEYADLDFFRRAGEIGEKIGFEWGGRWRSFPDRPHLQWSQGGRYTSSMILAGQRPPQMPLYQKKEEDDMTKEEVQKLVEAAVAAARPKVYTDLAQVPEWAQALVGRAMDAGILHGSGGGRLHLTDDNLVSLQMLANANIF